MPKLCGAFRLLAPQIQKVLKERGFLHPTPPQQLAIPVLLRGENALIIAPTGTGKTEAAILPFLDHLIRERDRPVGVRILYVTPLRALNRDILHRLTWWCERLGVSVGVRHGDTSSRERARQAREPPEFLITTPETLQILLVAYEQASQNGALGCCR